MFLIKELLNVSMHLLVSLPRLCLFLFMLLDTSNV